MIEFLGTLCKFDFNHWQHHIPLENEVADAHMDNANRRVLIWINEEGPYHMAIFKAKTYWYILINQQHRSRFNLEVGDQVKLKMARDFSEFGHEVPEEFQVMLDQDEEANTIFRALTPGKQRGLIYIVTKVKNPESRMKKSLAIMHHLRLSKGNLDGKQLNELIKYYNNL
jgi:hypothetical protein